MHGVILTFVDEIGEENETHDQYWNKGNFCHCDAFLYIMKVLLSKGLYS